MYPVRTTLPTSLPPTSPAPAHLSARTDMAEIRCSILPCLLPTHPLLPLHPRQLARILSSPPPPLRPPAHLSDRTEMAAICCSVEYCGRSLGDTRQSKGRGTATAAIRSRQRKHGSEKLVLSGQEACNQRPSGRSYNPLSTKWNRSLSRKYSGTTSLPEHACGCLFKVAGSDFRGQLAK